MKMTLRSNAYAALVAWEIGVGETNCAATDDGGYQALTIITDSSRVQTTPAIGTADCKVEAPAGDVRKLYIIQKKTNTHIFIVSSYLQKTFLASNKNLTSYQF